MVVVFVIVCPIVINIIISIIIVINFTIIVKIFIFCVCGGGVVGRGAKGVEGGVRGGRRTLREEVWDMVGPNREMLMPEVRKNSETSRSCGERRGGDRTDKKRGDQGWCEGQ